MHAQYVRVWFVAGLAALALCLPLSFLEAPESMGAGLLVVGLSYLSLAVVLGLLPAFARRDWPSPVYAWAAALLGALGAVSFLVPDVFYALLGVSLVLGALQPLALLLSPKWTMPREPNPHRSMDAAAWTGALVALVGAAVGGLLLIGMPRNLPNAGLAMLLLGCALPAAFSALLFLLPRQSSEPLRAATLAYAALAFLALAAGALAWAFARPFAANFRAPVSLVALAFALGMVALLRGPRPTATRGLLAGALALAILAALALLLATITGAPNALLPVALFAHAALAAVLLGAALTLGAPLLLPGRPRGSRWLRWAPALLIASLFLYTPAIQYGRGTAPALLAGAAGLALLVWGMAPMARARRT